MEDYVRYLVSDKVLTIILDASIKDLQTVEQIILDTEDGFFRIPLTRAMMGTKNN